MNYVTMRVVPAAKGWSIDCDLPIEPTYYWSGARAEQVARRIANHLRGAGLDVKISVCGLDGAVVGTHRYAGWPQAPEITPG